MNFARLHKKSRTNSNQPLHRDGLGRLIFADGSMLDDASYFGELTVSECDEIDWNQLEGEAFSLGKSHRLARRKFDSAFKRRSRRHPDRVCLAYRIGYFSVPSWPKYGTD